MKNIEVAMAFDEIADLLEITEGDPFKVRAYRRASQVLVNLPEPIENLVREGRLLDVPGIGKALAKKAEELVTTGKLQYLEDLRHKVPPGLLDFIRIPGVGAKTASTIYKELGIETVEELETAAKSGRLQKIRGMGEKKIQNILQGIETQRRHSGRVLLGIALPIAQGIVSDLYGVPGVTAAEVAGSVRRRKETVGDVDIVVASVKPDAVMERFVGLNGVREVIVRGETKTSVVFAGLGQVDLRAVAPDQYPAALQYFTGSKNHNVRLRGIAKQIGYKLNEYGLFKGDSDRSEHLEDEAAIYAKLGLGYIPPEIREDSGEIEAALERGLPTLLEVRDIKGDLHVHTRWSDGTASISEMADAAIKRGYEYIAICDHTKALGVTGGLDEDRLIRQGEEIRSLNEAYKERGIKFRILRGTEVDILADGTLDIRDEVLRELDIVVASIHTGMRQDPEIIHRRLEAAMQNEHVDIIGHPTGRLIG
ncbi:MAG TPA: DNA polymerase/3'-5' exonuclease PolX, partial [Clostridia bacterium]|nr:DNA polymerase/3'-5' exonuclease PolX [Clostridia bacterium]